jgi:hypothetical protein
MPNNKGSRQPDQGSDWVRWLLPVVLVFGAGLGNGVMDKVQFHFGDSVFAKLSPEQQLFWNPKHSWKNKYVDWDAGDQRPAFFLATTALVALTDAWHLFQSLMITAFVLAILAYRRPAHRSRYVVDFLVLKLAFSGGFTLMFDWLLCLPNV